MNQLYINKRIEQSIHKIIKIVDAEYPFLGIKDFEPFANGVENLVFKARSNELGNVAIKTPLEQFVNNDNDGSFHARRLLDKEISLTHHVSKYGIPVPTIHQDHFSDEIDFIICEFIDGDKSEVTAKTVGSLLTNLHQVPLPDAAITKQQVDEWYKPIAERIISRTKIVEKITGCELPLCSSDQLCSIFFESWNAQLAILHLDIRPANFITFNGEIKALLDWSNTLIGDPCLEIMRILEQEELNPSFLNEYRLSNYVDQVPEIIKTLYRYDAIVMMTVLFLSEIHDKKMGEHYFKKLEAINKNLRLML